jgi:hypothetical protein
MNQHVVDADGHKWPVSGLWCSVCGMPLHRILEAVGMHPNCGEE